MTDLGAQSCLQLRPWPGGQYADENGAVHKSIFDTFGLSRAAEQGKATFKGQPI